MKIIPLLNEDVTKRVISEKNILPSDVDWPREVSLTDFIEYRCTGFSFFPDDFLLQLDDDTALRLKSGEFIPLSAAQRIGWYAQHAHYTNLQLLENACDTKLNNLRQVNPAIIIASFDVIRNHVIRLKKNNILSGGFALCYAMYRDEFDDFFMQFDISRYQWRFPRNKYNIKKHSFFMFLLSLFVDQVNGDVFSKLVNEEKSYDTLKKIFTQALRYFTYYKYDASSFTAAIASELKKYPENKETTEALIELLTRYINNGIHYTVTDKFTTLIKEFLDLAQTETEKLRAFLENRPFNRKATIFLLGMLHTASRLEDQFQFQNFELLFPSLFAECLFSVEITNNNFIFHFNPAPDPYGMQKMDIANRAINMIKISKNILPHMEAFEHYTELFYNSTELKNAIENIKNSINSLREEKSANEKTLTELRKENIKIQNEINKLRAELDKRKKQNENLTKDDKNAITQKIETENTASPEEKHNYAQPKLPFNTNSTSDESAHSNEHSTQQTKRKKRKKQGKKATNKNQKTEETRNE